MNTMSRSAPMTDEATASLAILIDELTDRLQAGEQLDLEAFLLDHPRHAESLRKLAPALEVMGVLKQSTARGITGSPSTGHDQHLAPSTLGDFQILREIGRGGMGVVYEAEQISLSRRVALKVLPFASTLDPKQLQRFQIEAQAAACLHHTNIVPVHAIGCDRGVHFYAMQLIDGSSLTQLIAELRRQEGLDPAEGPAPPPALADMTPTTLAASLLAGRPDRPSASEDGNPDAPTPDPPSETPEPAAPQPPPEGRASALGSSTRDRSYIVNVARLGLQAAEALDHAHTRGILHRDIKPGNLLVDTESRLWVTDFGLAQVQGDSRLTLTGDILGTLRYMSPEQALGRRVVIDGRTDLYSLGVTLYELLTLRPALDGRDRAEILRRIAEHEPAPLRKLNPSVPRDLETIVHKAMAKETAERYPSAIDLADDLRRFLDGQTIQARRPNLLDRAVKWTRRHAAAVTTALGVLTLAVIGLAISNQLIWRERQEALEAQERAETQQAIAEMVRDFFQNRLLAQADPSNEPDRDILLRTVLDRAAEEITHGFDGHPVVEAEIHQTIGSTYRSLGLFEQAKGHLERAYELFQHMYDEEHPDTLDVLDNLGLVYQDQGKLDEAEPAFLQALEGRHRVLGAEHPNTLTTRHNLGSLYRVQGKLDVAESYFLQALKGRHRVLGTEHPDTLATLNSLGVLSIVQGKLDAAESYYLQALEGRSRVLGEEHPDTLMTRNNIGALYRVQGKLDAAETYFLQRLEKMGLGLVEPVLLVIQRSQVVEQFQSLVVLRAQLAASPL